MAGNGPPKPTSDGEHRQKIADDLKFERWASRVKDLILYGFGVYLLLNELVLQHGEIRPQALVVIGGLLGLPSAFSAARKRGSP